MRAGFGLECITPDRPIWMAGYGSRDHRSEGVYQDLWAKALVLDDGETTLALVTADLIGLDPALVAAVRTGVQERLGLAPERLMLNCSHTHCGPNVSDPDVTCYPERDDEYVARLTDKLIAVVEQAAATREEADLSLFSGTCTLSVNRRRPAPGGARMEPNPLGPTDPEVAILQVRGQTASAVVVNYSCHPTTMGDYLIGGDYPGFMQTHLEQELPCCHAMFLSGCHGDLKPRNVDGKGLFKGGPVEVVKGFGRELAQAVLTAISLPGEPVTGPLEAGSATVHLPFADPPTVEELQQAQRSEDHWTFQWGDRLLRTLAEQGSLPTTRPFEIQVFRLGDLTLIGLGGEILVEYALRIKRDLRGRRVIVAGYCNALAGYIPPANAFVAGGYETHDSYRYGPWPAPYRPEIESLIIAQVMGLTL